MKLPLVATRLGIAAFKLMVAAIVVLSIIPLLTGGIGIDLENEDEAGMTLEGSVVHAEMPITVRNDGYFDINDLTLSFTFMNEEGDVLAVSEGDPMDIPAGRETEVAIGLALDLYDLDRQVRSDLIFNGTKMMFDAEVSVKYILDMVQLSVEAGSDMGWGPFIRDLQVEEWNAQPLEEGDDRFVEVPFSFSAEDVLNGYQAYAVTEYRDQDGYTSNVTQPVTLSQQVSETAKIPLSQEAYGRFINGTANATARTTLCVLDCWTFDEGYLGMGGGGGGQEDPIYDLSLNWEYSFIQDDGDNQYLIVPYTFRTYPAYQGQQAQVYIEYWDSQGFQGNVNEVVNMWDQVSNMAWIPLTQVSYDRVYYGQEQVDIRLNVYYQSYSGFDQQVFTEQWGAGL